MPEVISHLARALAVAAAALACSACVALGGVDRATATIDKSVGQARNNSILLNIVRASRGEPLYFYAVSRVSGTGIEDFKLSLPAVTFGPRQTAAQKTYTVGTNGLDVLDSQRSGSFDVAFLDSKNFYEGMLAPLDLLEVNLLLKQGFPRELVYRLAVQDVVVISDDSGPRRLVDYPGARGQPDFNRYFDLAIEHGVSTETFMVAPKAAARASGDDKTKADPPKPTPRARLCFDETLIPQKDTPARLLVEHSGAQCGERPPGEAEGGQAPLSLREAYDACRNGVRSGFEALRMPDESQSRTDKEAEAKAALAVLNRSTNVFCGVDKGRAFVIQLDTRSLYGIFQYLGAALHAQDDPLAQLSGTGGEAETHAERGPLVRIVTGHDRDCFAQAAWGDRYCVPRDGGENLKTTFSIINALQALKTSPGDLPVTPAVRIEQ